MKKSLILSLVTGIMMSVLVSCGSDSNDGSGEMFDASLYKNPQSLDPQIACDVSSRTVISNMFSGLLALDSEGAIVNDNAESYEISDDGLTYRFRLRRDNYWFCDLRITVRGNIFRLRQMTMFLHSGDYSILIRNRSLPEILSA